MGKIQDDNLFYELLRKIVKLAYLRFFRQIEIRGAENIPTGVPVIFAPNHQNALMDALGVLFFQKDPIVFLARADIFKKPTIAKLLRILKLAPIYRIRDGYENLAKNKKQMKGAENVLLENSKLCLMPEGNQGEQHKLRPLLKGMFRIACSAEEKLKGKAHVTIIPVGIDYSYYQHAGSDLVLTYGKPIEVKDYMNLYKDKPSNALNSLKDILSKNLSLLMHDIKSTAHYEMIYNLCCYGTHAYLEVQTEKGVEFKATTAAGLRFDARCALGIMLDQIDREGPNRILEMNALCGQLKKLPGYPAEVAEWMELKRDTVYNLLSITLTILFLPGFLLNLPAWTINHLINKNVEDRQMHSTFAFTIGMIINAITYISATIVVCSILRSGFAQILLCLTLIFFLGIIGERVRQSSRIAFRSLLYSLGSRRKLIKRCRSDYASLKETMKKNIRMSSF